MITSDPGQLKCCWRCYNQALLAWFALSGKIPLSDPATSTSSNLFKETFTFTDDHDECQSCRRTMESFGYDPCDEMKMSEPDFVEKTDPMRRYPFLHLFHHILGFDAVTEDGDYVDFVDHRIQNWVAEVDSQMDRFSDP